MFIDYKLENYMFRHFIGHRQVISKITLDNSVCSVRAGCVDVEICPSTQPTHALYIEWSKVILEINWRWPVKCQNM